MGFPSATRWAKRSTWVWISASFAGELRAAARPAALDFDTDAQFELLEISDNLVGLAGEKPEARVALPRPYHKTPDPCRDSTRPSALSAAIASLTHRPTEAELVDQGRLGRQLVARRIVSRLDLRLMASATCEDSDGRPPPFFLLGMNIPIPAILKSSYDCDC